jgi:hypothetical protein
MRNEYMPLVIQSPEDKAGAAKVHQARMTVKNTRISVEKKRKELKEDALRFGQAVDAEARRITTELVEIESHLEAQEAAVAAEVKRRADEAARIRRERLDARMAALADVRSFLSPALVEPMSDEQFQAELASAAAANRARIEKEQEEARAKDAERVRIEQELAAERERLAAEQARMDAERRERERLQAEAQAAIDAERRALEQERLRLKVEEEKRLAAEQARMDERLRLERAEAARVEREQAAERERIRREAARPTVEQIQSYANKLLLVELPEVPQKEELRKIVQSAAAQVRALSERI